MAKGTHLNVTIDFTKWGAGVYDLRVPKHQTTKALLINLMRTLNIGKSTPSSYTIKVANKAVLLTDDDRILDFQVTDGDILEIL